jgi:hypothetical protein
MTVSTDALGTQKDSASTVTSFNYTNITVGSSSNRALIFILGTSGGAAAATSPAATWDNGGSNQAMTLLTNVAATSDGNHGVVWLFGLRNPTSGAKTLAVSWTTASTYAACARSYNGVDQSSDANAFKNRTTNAAATGTSASLTVTSAVGDFAVNGFLTSGAAGSGNQTQIFLDTNPTDDVGGQEVTGAASISFTWGIGASSPWAMVGCDIAAAAAASPVLANAIRRFLKR